MRFCSFAVLVGMAPPSRPVIWRFLRFPRLWTWSPAVEQPADLLRHRSEPCHRRDEPLEQFLVGVHVQHVAAQPIDMDATCLLTWKWVVLNGWPELLVQQLPMGAVSLELGEVCCCVGAAKVQLDA